ncbi:MAG: Ribose ABC transport system, ATP-binding protein RbsA [Hydrogenibacillus schlegelii]|uniref:Ribose ABC transport system, ATP-binding protein RbsA n=1 Tax=Hydrogenibacillus schlegelii TaxID=1484 RepID=A0A2T5GDJ8_HYDSH|nr:sugar ABC transporter ATP-binding protein [Hydrogenibacillus schlegelii]PTQ54266.1 MAG: Ribose ABC transport system, ATP-binding protein RbsA [Hydrogenibacillus schlegelii]
MAHVLSVHDLSLSFPGVQALRGVDAEFRTGEVHAVVGANGAGKSTLMKVLSGLYTHYTGEIRLDGRPVRIHNPAEARALGIDIVYQEVDAALVPSVSVAENIALDWLTHGAGSRRAWVRWRDVYALGKEALATLGIELDVRRPVASLSLAEKQLVLIARSIVERRRFLILDEPTAALSAQESQELFRVIRDLVRRDRIGVLFISHRIPELYAIGDRITIMRDGRVVHRGRLNEIQPEAIVRAMLGRTLSASSPARKKPGSDERPILAVQGLADREGRIDGVSFHVRPGEVVGIAGLVGAGKTELCQALIGARPIRRGTIVLRDRAVRLRNPGEAVRHGIVLVPEERRKEGLWLDASVAWNLTIAALDRMSPWGILRSGAIEHESDAMIRTLGIKTPHPHQAVAYLSGGNQQKVVIGRWLLRQADVYLFDEPTKGIDVGAKAEILDLIRRLAEAGKAVLYATSEFAELLQVADRIYVMYAGKIVRELAGEAATESKLLYYASGGM